MTTTATPALPTDERVRDAVRRLSRIVPGGAPVVSCYMKLELRDKTRGKYLIKLRNRVRTALAGLADLRLDPAARKAVAADLERVQRFFERTRVPQGTRGMAVFASKTRGLFEVIPLPHVYRSRLAVRPVPLVGELLALEAEFGTILVAACDRSAARFFAVTAFGVEELPGLVVPSSRTSKFHGSGPAAGHPGQRGGTMGERHHHQRIREEKHRLYAAIADRLFHLSAGRPVAGLAFAGIGVDAAAVIPHLHTYLHDLVLGAVRLTPKRVSPAQVREAALALRDQREQAWERAHAEAVVDGLATGWAVNGVEATLQALERGQVRTLIVDGRGDDPGLDDAVEEALAQRAQIDVLYDERARRAVDGLAALLRFRT